MTAKRNTPPTPHTVYRDPYGHYMPDLDTWQAIIDGMACAVVVSLPYPADDDCPYGDTPDTCTCPKR